MNTVYRCAWIPDSRFAASGTTSPKVRRNPDTFLLPNQGRSPQVRDRVIVGGFTSSAVGCPGRRAARARAGRGVDRTPAFPAAPEKAPHRAGAADLRGDRAPVPREAPGAVAADRVLARVWPSGRFRFD